MLQFISQLDDIRLIIVLTISLCAVLLISFSLHEYAHAYVAYKCGDPTAKALGRLSINPMAHIDPIGFIFCLLFGFGWAKPVPINPNNFRRYKSGLVYTSIAGVVVNLILAIIGCGLFYTYFIYIAKYITNEYLFYLIYYFFRFMFTINISLMVFNLLPIPPLDGFNVIAAVTKYENKFVSFMRSYGTIILLLILFAFDGILLKFIDIIGTPIEKFWVWIFSLF